jgi:chemotaxis protein MotA
MMDFLSIIGILIGLVAIIGGNFLEGGHFGSLLQLTAFLIVAGGTLGAVVLQSPQRDFLRGLRMLSWIVSPPRIENEIVVEKIIEWSKLARKEGLLSLEDIADEETDTFTRKGLHMLIDGSEPETIRMVMEVDIDTQEQAYMAGAKVFEAAGGYAPTIGILGAVMGLIHVMENLSDPSKLGSGIAVAFVATIYGVGGANLFLLPIAAKLRSIVQRQVSHNEMILDGLVAIAQGENPRSIESKLLGYLSE